MTHVKCLRQDNSFEQLCINYVNEKLQQIFIELTLKTEQEEYVREQIKWTPIKYFNNKIVCDLIEERRPPGIFAALNDACATAHADPAAADNSFIQRTAGLASNPHFEARGAQFLVRHYAGDVMYNVAGMTDKNKDLLVKDLLDLIGTSGNQFLQGLFPDRPDPNSKKRPPTASDRIKVSAAILIDQFRALYLVFVCRLRLAHWSKISCAPSHHTFGRSSLPRTEAPRNTTPRPCCTRSNTLVCRRTSASDARVLRTGTRLKRWSSVSTSCLLRRRMRASISGRAMPSLAVSVYLPTLVLRARSGRWVSRRRSSRTPRL